MTALIWNPGNIIFPQSDGTTRIYQPHYRRNMVVSSAAYAPFLARFAEAGESGLSRATAEAIWDAQWAYSDSTSFTLYDHAYANPAMFDPSDVDLTTQGPSVAAEVLDYMLDAGFLATEWPIVYSHEKQSFAQQFKGSFYEQIGTECLFARREPTEWWTSQKFEADGLSTRQTPYHYIQDRFLENYLKTYASDKSIIEIGCGTGYYTNRMAQVAGNVVGIDYNPKYVERAKTIWQDQGEKHADYAVCDIIDFKSDRPDLIETQYDRVILIDTFLFLFHETYQPELFAARETVLKNMARLLKPGGRILIMDPHPLFLTPWFGDPNRPFGILESYNTHYFRVIPTLEEVSGLFYEAGLSIMRIIEPTPHPDFADIDPTANAFYNEVPAWWMIELQPSNTTE